MGDFGRKPDELKSNAELIKKHKAHNRFRDSKQSLCDVNRNIAKEEDGTRKYKCFRCNTYKSADDFNAFQLIKPFSCICASCQSKATPYNNG